MIQNSCYESDLRELTPNEIEEYYSPLVDIDAVDSFGDTLLLAACKNKQVEYVKYYLARGANTNYVNKCGESPIHVLIDTVHHNESESVILAKLLINAGTDLELRAYMDKTPFLRACGRNSLAMLELLVNSGCDTKAVVKENDSTLDGVWFSECFRLSKEIREYVKNITNS